MSTNNNDTLAPKVEFPKYHAGEDLIRTMMANLTANNRDPSRIEAKLDERTVAAANPAPVVDATTRRN
jgi:hypothetical protein